MTVAVCIASRGRPDELEHTIAKAREASVVPGTHFCVALDQDDETLHRYQLDGSRCSRSVREDSLGAKYNRAVRGANADASLFVLGVDDAYLASPGWDRVLLNAASQFQDGVGVVYCGPRKGAYCLPETMAVTRGWIEQVGYFMPEHFPFWWHDTWIDELARMTGRFVWADVAWEKYGASEVAGHKTTRMRGVKWWAKFFDDTRPERMAKALDMITALEYPAWLRSQLISELPGVCSVLAERNRMLREHGDKFERDYGAENGADAGYERLVRAAVERVGG